MPGSCLLGSRDTDMHIQASCALRSATGTSSFTRQWPSGLTILQHGYGWLTLAATFARPVTFEPRSWVPLSPRLQTGLPLATRPSTQVYQMYMSRQKAGRSTFHSPSRAHEGCRRERQAFTTRLPHFYAVLEFQNENVPDLRVTRFSACGNYIAIVRSVVSGDCLV